LEQVLKRAEKDEKVLILESEALMKNFVSNKWNRYKKSAYKPIIAILQGKNSQEEKKGFEDECMKYAQNAITKISNVLRFGERSLGKSQEFASAVSGMIANEKFIGLITEVDWQEIYEITSQLYENEGKNLIEKAQKALRE
jgi:hypothetical protein